MHGQWFPRAEHKAILLRIRRGLWDLCREHAHRDISPKDCAPPKIYKRIYVDCQYIPLTRIGASCCRKKRNPTESRLISIGAYRRTERYHRNNTKSTPYISEPNFPVKFICILSPDTQMMEVALVYHTQNEFRNSLLDCYVTVSWLTKVATAVCIQWIMKTTSSCEPRIVLYTTFGSDRLGRGVVRQGVDIYTRSGVSCIPTYADTLYHRVLVLTLLDLYEIGSTNNCCSEE